MKKISRVSTIISAIMLLTYIIVLISIWSRIPDTDADKNNNVSK